MSREQLLMRAQDHLREADAYIDGDARLPEAMNRHARQSRSVQREKFFRRGRRVWPRRESQLLSARGLMAKRWTATKGKCARWLRGPAQ